MPLNYVELHCHSCFSLLDGASTPESLLDRAVALEMPALALTDRDGLYAAVRFCCAAQDRGIKPILGAEVTLEGEHHLLLLAENQAGYRHLCWLLSRAQLRGGKGNARLPLELLRQRHEGLIALTAYRRGAVAAALLAGGADRRDRAREELERLTEIFDPEHLYVELQHHLLPDDDALCRALAALADELGLDTVVTNDAHYAQRADHRLHDTLRAIDQNLPLAQAQRYLLPNSEYYLKSADEMAALFAEQRAALERSAEIAARCEVSLDFRAQAIPPMPEIAENVSPDGLLTRLCYASLARHYPDDDTAARRQLDHELAVIRQIDLAGYFILVWQIVHHAQENGIQVRGRGSAANSIVAYLLDITNVDPLAHDLLFERFLSAEARVMPDIDLDFCARRREEVIQHLYERYGESHVAMVCTYVTYRRKSALRDVGKALGLTPDAIQALADELGDALKVGWSFERPTSDTHDVAPPGYGPKVPSAALRAAARVAEAPSSSAAQLLSLCTAILGIPRHLSIHVGGMCITRVPLDELVPIEPATMPDRVVTQWDKDGIEDAGLIKIDILSLRTLAAVDECLDLITENHGIDLDLDTLPLDDPAVYRDLQAADTVGAFQVESRAQQQALVKMKPRNFRDIAVEVALIRPGPLQGNMVAPFFKRRMGLEPVTYLHPLLEPILRETLGVIVFQEQVIRVAMVVGGFTPGEADMLRRAMSRHRGHEEMAAFRRRFVSGALERGVDHETADTLFTQLSGFASYGFCKSHAVAFAKTAYDTLYLRAHYPTEYYCSLLNNQPMGFYAPRVLVRDAKRHGIAFRHVDINRSQERCTVEGGAIRMGLEYVDGLGEAVIQRILDARAPGPFRDLPDFCRRSALPRRLVENLIMAGAMDAWCPDKRQSVWRLGELWYREEALPLEMPATPIDLAPMSPAEELRAEYWVTGLSVEGHLMELYRDDLDKRGIGTSRDLEKARNGQRALVAGMLVVRQRPPTAKGFAFLTLEDEWGLMNIIVQPKVFEAQEAVWTGALVMVVEGQVEKAEGMINVMAARGWRVG